jgi:hypothetical protein
MVIAIRVYLLQCNRYDVRREGASAESQKEPGIGDLRTGLRGGGDTPSGSRELATTDRGERPPVLQRRSGSLLQVAVNSRGIC